MIRLWHLIDAIRKLHNNDDHGQQAKIYGLDLASNWYMLYKTYRKD